MGTSLRRWAGETPALRCMEQSSLVAALKPCFYRAMKQLTIRLLGRLILPAFLSLGLAGCVTNPETGRRQLLIVPESQMIQLGLSSFDQMKQQQPISRDPAANAVVQRVGGRIHSVVNLPNAQWEFVVFESQEANAFCLPGGSPPKFLSTHPPSVERIQNLKKWMPEAKAATQPQK